MGIYKMIKLAKLDDQIWYKLQRDLKDDCGYEIYYTNLNDQLCDRLSSQLEGTNLVPFNSQTWIHFLFLAKQIFTK